jgi:hypothetical protein
MTPSFDSLHGEPLPLLSGPLLPANHLPSLVASAFNKCHLRTQLAR